MVKLDDVTCSKNPGHNDFIPAEVFALDHLPANYRDVWRLNVIKAMIELTVHLSVRAISAGRPRFYPGSHVPYPFYKPDGGSQRRTGSGFVYWVAKCGEKGLEEKDKPCRCPSCRESASPKKTWWKVCVHTTRYVVWDDVEAKDSELRFFFNETDSQRKVSVRCVGHLEGDRTAVGRDLSELLVIVCDDVIGERLETAWRNYRTIRRAHDRQPGSDLAVVVAHPHGCAKYVTVGKLVAEQRGEEGGTRAIYTAKTCPGSGGGMVWAGVWDEVWEQGGYPRHTTYQHAESLPDTTNRSGLGGWERW